MERIWMQIPGNMDQGNVEKTAEINHKKLYKEITINVKA